jgi:hypothetical protein
MASGFIILSKNVRIANLHRYVFKCM